MQRILDALPEDAALPDVVPIMIPMDFVAPAYNNVALSVDCLSEHDMTFRPKKRSGPAHHWHKSNEAMIDEIEKRRSR